MATLVSPGVNVSVIDESIGISSGEGTVPFILIATAQDKTVPDGSDTAVGTTAANAGKVYLMSSQRELLQTFGDPIFQSIGGTQIHGDPTNEYGLLAAHSYLGLANRAYVVRADIDTAELESSVSQPTTPKPIGTVWLDTNDTIYGINRFVPGAVSGEFVPKAQPVSLTTDVLPLSATGELESELNNLAQGSIVVYFKPESSFPAPQVASQTDEIEYYVKDTNTGLVADDWKLISSTADSYIASAIQPIGQSEGAWWLKTSAGVGNQAIGSDFVVRVRDITGSYVIKDAPTFVSDAEATTYYNGTPSDGDLYVQSNAVSSISELREYDSQSSAWTRFVDYYASDIEPRDPSADGALWYNPDVGLDGDGNSTVDLLVNNADSGANEWIDVLMPGFDYDPASLVENPSNRPTGRMAFTLSTDPSPIYTTAVLDGDIWIDTDQLAEYPVMYRRAGQAWVEIDNSDQTSPNGVLFQDARVDPDSALDFDAPDPDAYPVGFMVWNTRFSTRNVKVWDEDYVYDEDTGLSEGRWLSASGNAQDGSPLMGDDARKAMVVKAMAEVLVGNEDLRSETLFFNLIATPGYPEVIDEMISLNIDRKETAFIVGDSPFDLPAGSTDLLAWSSNQNNAPGNGSDGLVSADPNLGIYYPSGLGTNVDGSEVVVPPSHMILRVMGFNDQLAYPWFAPAGLQRGRVTNAAAVGYLDDESEFVPVTLNQGQRDTLYTNKVNPITFIPNQGLVVYGQKTRNPAASALDRVNVARLVEYIRFHSERMSQPFLFEPNDTQTRSNVKDAFDRFMAELVTLRGLYDFLVVCDTSNNTSARIDRNELWIDIAIQPVKAIEFIYIPIRIRATGSDLSI